MIDEATGQELVTVEPQLNIEQTEQEAEEMNVLMAEQQLEATEVPQGEEETGIMSSVVKPIAKMLGMETASDVSQVVAPQLSEQAQKQSDYIGKKIADHPKVYETPVKENDFARIAKKLITKEKLLPKVEKTPLKNMVVKAPKKVPTPEDKEKVILNATTNGQIIDLDPLNVEKSMLGLKTSDIDNFNTNDAFQLNFDTIRDEEGLAETLAYMAKENEALIQAERGEAGTDEYIKSLAKDIGADENFVNDVLTWENGGALPTSGHVMAIRQTLDQSAMKLREMSMLPDSELSPKDRADFVAQYDFHRRFQAKYMGMRAELSRSFRAVGIPYDKNELEEFLARAESGIDITELRKAIRNSEDTRGINDMVNKYADPKKYTADLFYTSYMGNILSGLGTQGLVFAGSLANMASRITERKVTSWMPRPKGALDEVESAEADIMLATMRSSMFDASKSFWKTFTSGEAYKGLASYGDRVELPLPSVGYKQSGAFGKAMDAGFKGMTFMMRNAMGGQDAFFTTLNERAELMALAYRDAKSKIDEGLISPEQFEQYLRQTIENPTEDMAHRASTFAAEIGVREPAGEFTASLQRAVSKGPGLRYIVPFMGVISNQIKQTIGERTPLLFAFGPLRKKYFDDIEAGGARKQIAQTKLAMGTGYLLTFFGLSEAGKMTGSYPNDQATRDLWKANGIQPYSFVFEGENGKKNYVSYQGLEPYATLAGIASSFSQSQINSKWQELTKDDEQQYNNFVGDMLYATSESVLNKTFATGLQTFFDAFKSEEQARRLATNFISGAVPFSGALRNVTKAIDDVKRDSGGFFEDLASRIPLLSEGLAPQVDIFGEDMQHKTNTFRWGVVESTDDPVRIELERLNEVMGRMAVTEFKSDFGGQGSTPHDRAEWVKYARKDRKDEEGRTLHDNLSDIILHDEDYAYGTSFDKVQMISSFVRNWDNGALSELEQDNPTLHEKLTSRNTAKKALFNMEKLNMEVDEAKESAKREMRIEEEF